MRRHGRGSADDRAKPPVFPGVPLVLGARNVGGTMDV